MEQLNVKEGVAAFNGMQTWYRITGDLSSAQTPLVVAHGGPGCTHDYVLSIAKIAEFGRPVIHYDQVGNGKSTRLTDKGPDFFTVDLFLDELNNLVEHLGIADNYFLLGQSWGGMLGAEHGIRQPQGLKGLIISNSPASMELWASEAKVLRSKLPADVRDTLDRHEANGTMDDPEYVAAADKFYAEHVCRVVPNPPEVVATFECMQQDNHVYLTMNGPYEYYCVGTLKDWTVVDEVHKITAPTLLVSGRYDEATPATVQPFFDNIPDVQWEIFEESSHMPFVEETDRYMQVVEEFMAAHDH